MNISKIFYFYICRAVRLPVLEKQVDKRTKSKQTPQDSEELDGKPPGG